MQLHVPDDILDEAGLTEEGCRIELAVQLYASQRLRLAPALRLCGLTRIEFDEELARRDVSLYSVDDLHTDVASLQELNDR